MEPYFGPQESASEVTLERHYLATDFLSRIGYGVQGVLYFVCTRYLWKQRKARRMNLFMLAYFTLLFLISSLVQVAQTHRTQLMFIENRNFPGSLWAYYEASISGTANIVGEIPVAALFFLSELFMVWPCWVVWYSVSRRMAYTVAFFPALMLVASLTAAIVYFVAILHPGSPAASIRAWSIVYYTLMLSTNVVTTAIILTRLIAHRREVRKAVDTAHAGEYTSLISMMVESAALYSIIGASCLIVSGVGNPVGGTVPQRHHIFTGVSPTLVYPLMRTDGGWKQISGYLIVMRLAHGRGWQTTTMSVHSKIVIRRNASASNTPEEDEGDSNTESIH